MTWYTVCRLLRTLLTILEYWFFTWKNEVWFSSQIRSHSWSFHIISYQGEMATNDLNPEDSLIWNALEFHYNKLLYTSRLPSNIGNHARIDLHSWRFRGYTALPVWTTVFLFSLSKISFRWLTYEINVQSQIIRYPCSHFQQRVYWRNNINEPLNKKIFVLFTPVFCIICFEPI